MRPAELPGQWARHAVFLAKDSPGSERVNDWGWAPKLESGMNAVDAVLARRLRELNPNKMLNVRCHYSGSSNCVRKKFRSREMRKRPEKAGGIQGARRRARWRKRRKDD